MYREHLVTLVLSVLALGASAAPFDDGIIDNNWYKNALVYQIYPRSFKDSNGDGIGDLNGITSKLEHIADIGADALWLSPIYTSPQLDFGYDIANFTEVDKDYGTLADFDRLVERAKSFGLKVILDFVPNHSSHEHPWFKLSAQRVKPYDEYYVWRNGTISANGTMHEPNNWLSVFGGSAWEYNAQRGQYYLHQFAVGQPDLNYRSPALNQEMKNVLSFWMDHGVAGFRIDAINHMFEDPRFPNEPLSHNNVPSDDYDYLDHPYTKNLNETYDVLRSWRLLMDEHSNRTRSDPRMILTEAYTDFDLTIKYYNSGSTVPFNFMFMGDLNNKSSALDFKRLADRWLREIENTQYVANWVVGNHDNHRAASRFGEQRADQLSMMSMMLPGVTVVYNGDEIGMVDRPFTYQETVDPAGCNAGPDRYQLKSRDPERTPFQWDATTSAGFSTSNRTWLPVHSNYKTLNLEMQKSAGSSHYKLFKQMSALKRLPILASRSSTLEITLVTEKVLAIVRRMKSVFGPSILVLLTNMSDSPVTIDASAWLNVPQRMAVYTASIGSKIPELTVVNMTAFQLPGAASVVLNSMDFFRHD